MHTMKQEELYDVRLIARHLEKGYMHAADVTKHVGNLADTQPNAEWMRLDMEHKSLTVVEAGAEE